MNRFLSIFILLLAPSIAWAGAHYTIVQNVAVSNGHLQVLLDSRLTPQIRKLMWETDCTDVDSLFDDSDPRLKPFVRKPILPAILRQVDPNGRAVVSLVPEKYAPIALIEPRNLGNPRDPDFLLDTDDSACMGSYSGRGVVFYHFDRGRIAPAIADENGKPSQIYLFRSLKSDWRIVKTKPGTIEIEQLLCRPDFVHDTGKGNMPFLLRYITFRFDGKRWTKAERVKSGFWEADNSFPPHSDFP